MKLTSSRIVLALGFAGLAAACGSSQPAEQVIVIVQGGDGGSGSGSGGGSGSGSSSGSIKDGGKSSGGSSGGVAADGSVSMPPPGDGAASSASGVPCDVANYLAANCTGCHSDPPITGALTGLVSYSDLTKTSIEDPTKTEIQLSIARMSGNPMPYMPPGVTPSASDVAILQNWLSAGLPMGTCGSADGGGDSGVVAPPSVFGGQPPFMSQTPHGGHNAGRACFQCHTSGCTGGGDCGQEMVFGGTLYDGSGNAVVGAEVRFVDANGNGTSVYTASNGDFWLFGSTAFAAPAHVGARNASATQDMHTGLQSTTQGPATTGGDCNACHCTGTGCTIAPIHLP